MRVDTYLKTVLTVIALLLGIIALRPAIAPFSAFAQTGPRSLYVEPGYTTLRKPDGTAQVKGKMVVNLNTGEIWGFPTLMDGPYPIDVTSTTAPISKPMYLGKFDLALLNRP